MFITADANLFLYKARQNAPDHYLRYSFNGVFQNTGLYCNDEPGEENWQKIQRDLGVVLKNWDFPKIEKIFRCVLQRNGGWSMKGKDVVNWANEKIAQIRQYTNRSSLLDLNRR